MSENQSLPSVPAGAFGEAQAIEQELRIPQRFGPHRFPSVNVRRSRRHASPYRPDAHGGNDWIRSTRGGLVCGPVTNARWVRFIDNTGREGFGTVVDDQVSVHSGDMFERPEPTGEQLPLASVTLLPPCRPTMMIALWNNLRAAADKNGWSTPAEPLYFLKPPSSFVAHGATVVRPSSYAGRILYEGELGIVIGKTCVDVAMEDVDDVCSATHASTM